MYMKPCMCTFPFRIMVEYRIYFEEKSYMVVKGTPSPYRIVFVPFWALPFLFKINQLVFSLKSTALLLIFHT